MAMRPYVMKPDGCRKTVSLSLDRPHSVIRKLSQKPGLGQDRSTI